MQGLAAAILCRAGPVLERGAWRPRLTQRPPRGVQGTFSQHAGGQQAPVPEAEGANKRCLTSGLGLGHSSGWNIDTEDWRGRGIWGGNFCPGPMGTPGHGDFGSAYHPADHSRPQYLRQGHVPPDGFQAAPLERRGGKPSLGRLAPWARPLSKAAVLGARICVLTSPWGDKLQELLSLGEGSHPFPEDLLEDIREILAPGRAADGQPFFLDILHSVALNIQDPDHQFPGTWSKGSRWSRWGSQTRP